MISGREGLDERLKDVMEFRYEIDKPILESSSKNDMISMVRSGARGTITNLPHMEIEQIIRFSVRAFFQIWG